MACEQPRPFYIPWTSCGIKLAASSGDGNQMVLHFRRAFASPSDYSLAYNIYYSSIQDREIAEGPKFVSTNTSGLLAEIVDFKPGDTYYFVVRATEYDSAWYDITSLPRDPGQADTNLYVYPETLLSEDIDDTQTVIPITDVDIFPNYGVIQVGYELIRYTSRDLGNGTLIGQRGFLNSNARLHRASDGYDGYGYRNPIVSFWKGCEEDNAFIIQEQNVYSSPNGIYTSEDGYRVLDRTSMLMADLSLNDDDRSDFPAYDQVGWHRTDPSLLFGGNCLDSYLGGETACADGYLGINGQIRNVSFSDQADRLQEFLLEQLGTGSECVLLRRLWKGITCSCMSINQEYPDARCVSCLGTSFTGGYEQYYNPRRGDSRILVRFTPTAEDLKMEDAGLESTANFDCWTLSYPALKDRDVLIRFNPDGTEEFRYEILDVTRGVLLYGQTGNQHFRVQRIRKTSPIYQWRAIRSTADFPVILTTTVGLLRGPNGTVIPHVHELVVSNNTVALSQINNTTNISENHLHDCISGIIMPAVMSGIEGRGHTHSIILP
jgi:hypothetical protein